MNYMIIVAYSRVSSLSTVLNCFQPVKTKLSDLWQEKFFVQNFKQKMPPKKKAPQKLNRKQQERLDAQQAFINNAVVFHKCGDSQQPISLSLDILTHIFGFLPVYPYLFYYTAIGKWSRSLIKELVMPSVERLYLVPFLTQELDNDENTRLVANEESNNAANSAVEEAANPSQRGGKKKLMTAQGKPKPVRFKSILHDSLYKESFMKPVIVAKFAKAPLYSLKYIYLAYDVRRFKPLLDELLYANESVGDGNVGRTYAYATKWQSITVIDGTSHSLLVPNRVPWPPILQLSAEEVPSKEEQEEASGKKKRKTKKRSEQDSLVEKSSVPVLRLQYCVVNCWLKNLATFKFYGYQQETVPIPFFINYSNTLAISDRNRFTRLSSSNTQTCSTSDGQEEPKYMHHFDECFMLNRLFALASSSNNRITIPKELATDLKNPQLAMNSLMNYMKFIASMLHFIIFSFCLISVI